MRRFLDLPLRRKLVLSFLVVMGSGGILLLVIGMRLEHNTVFSLAQAKVRHDLAAAWTVYNHRLYGLRDVVRLTADREVVRAILISGRTEAHARLDAVRREYELDVLTLVDAAGRVVWRARRPEATGDDLSADPLVRRALTGGTAAGTQIVSRAALEIEGPDLAARAYFEIVPTPMAAARVERFEENGMMLRAAAPVRDAAGAVRGALVGGLLFSRSYDLVDEVKDIVFKGEKYRDSDIGTVTIFQGDLRIATNVLDDRGERAVGTRVSREVENAVLRRGGSWVDRAFVVRDWYITAYEPIRDVEGRIVGMLYVGMLEKPYKDMRNRVVGTFALLAGAAAVFLLGILSYAATGITRPILHVVEATHRIAGGDLAHRVPVEAGDETGRLAASFNRMADNLAQAQADLTQWGRTLEKRVAERTRELQDMQAALIQSEKLASLGKIAAGIAHEINNPLTSILINAHLLLEAGPPDPTAKERLDLIAEETARCARIVRGLLDFARQTPSHTAPADVNEIIARTLQLLENQAAVRNIRIVRLLAGALPPIELDRDKMQQVFSNLIINALEAMPSDGVLTVASRCDTRAGRIEVSIADTGVGIPPDNVPKLFDPFFTTKEFGTGLGLAVSYGIVRRSGGEITVASEVGRGSVFTVLLPLNAAPDAESETGGPP